MNLNRLQKEKALRHLGYTPTDDFFQSSLTPELDKLLPAAYEAVLEADRITALHTLAQSVKNASLGKTPEQMGETLKVQVNMGIGGLLLLIKQLTIANKILLVSSNVCSVYQFDQAMIDALSPAEHAAVKLRTDYWTWVNQVDAEVAACIADPNRTPNFPAPPTL